jgi:hypothetical protein
MTAEVAILNTAAVALAADSAVSFGTVPKVYSSTNKLFALSKFQPVGVMFFNNASLLSVPWESTVKIYRDRLGSISFPRLEDYFNHFLSFIRSAEDLFPYIEQQKYVRNIIFQYFSLLRHETDDAVKVALQNNPKITKAAVQKILADTVARHYRKWREFETVADWSPRKIRGFIIDSESIISEIKDQVFQHHKFSATALKQLRQMAAMLFSKKNFGKHWSGIVVAGFGQDEIFPSLRSCWIEGITDKKLKMMATQFVDISPNMLASVVAFAQDEMVGTFMEGIDPKLLRSLEEYIQKLFNEYPDIVVSKIAGLDEASRNSIAKELKEVGAQVFEKFRSRTKDFCYKKYIEPVIEAVTALPKDELAAMAESLVSLTSFKRKVSTDAETVGGPVDVAVISKGDGFIWVKRKSYFDSNLNPRFHYIHLAETINRKEEDDGNKTKKRTTRQG